MGRLGRGDIHGIGASCTPYPSSLGYLTYQQRQLAVVTGIEIRIAESSDFTSISIEIRFKELNTRNYYPWAATLPPQKGLLKDANAQA